MITAATRVVVDAFLNELMMWKINDCNPPLHVVHRRVLLAEMVQLECGDDDLEALALQALADAAINLCWSPKDVPTAERYVAARQAHFDILKTGIQ